MVGYVKHSETPETCVRAIPCFVPFRLLNHSDKIRQGL